MCVICCRIIVTRSDYYYILPHPKLTSLSNQKVWIPEGEVCSILSHLSLLPAFSRSLSLSYFLSFSLVLSLSLRYLSISIYLFFSRVIYLSHFHSIFVSQGFILHEVVSPLSFYSRFCPMYEHRIMADSTIVIWFYLQIKLSLLSTCSDPCFRTL